MKLGIQVDLGPDHIVLDGDPAPPPQKGGGAPSNFRLILANVNSRSRSLYAVASPSVCRLSSVCLSVTVVHPTPAVVIFRNISAALGTLAIH